MTSGDDTLRGRDLHPFRSALGAHVLAVDGSRIYDIDDDLFSDIERSDDIAFSDMFIGRRRYIDAQPLDPPPLRSLSLNVAQGCNMACSYCYADEGRFGGRARLMPIDVAKKAVIRLLDDVDEGEDAVLGYMGGEPFVNRRLIHELTPFAADLAESRGVRLRFSVTTNATLLNGSDAALLSRFPFSVAVSLDGGRAANDSQRPMRDGTGSFERAVAGLRLLLDAEKPRHLSIRATVTPRTGVLEAILDDLLALGVDEAGFAPVLVSPNPADQFDAADFDRFLTSMIACGERCKASILSRRRYPFSNFETALAEIARGSHRPYPCGAAAGYASVSAEGRVFACHRLIDSEDFAIGSLEGGLDDGARQRILAERHVLKQTPCKDCWARFLCGGGCHHEVAARGRVGCDYIRGWLDFCLGAYAEISERRPDYFNAPETYFPTVGEH